MILVTGCLGFLGQSLLQRLLDHGIGQLRLLLRPGTEQEKLEKLRALHSSIQCVQCSMNDQDGLNSALQGVKTVIHLAASKQGGAAAQVANTVVSTDHLLKACVGANVDRVILISSFGVFDASSVNKSAVIDENTGLELHPERRDPYSFTKHMQEKLAWHYHQEHKLPLVVIRPGVIYGPGEALLSPRIGLSLFGLFLHLGGNNRIPLTYVDNCSDAIIKAVKAENIVGEAFCIVDDNLPTSKELLKSYQQYRKKTGQPKRFFSLPIPYGLLWILSVFNEWYYKKSQAHLPLVFSRYKIACMWKGHNFTNNKAKAQLNFEPRISVEEGVEKTLYSS